MLSATSEMLSTVSQDTNLEVWDDVPVEGNEMEITDAQRHDTYVCNIESGREPGLLTTADVVPIIHMLKL